MMLQDEWAALEAQATSAGPGEARRRIHPESVADLWLVVFSPSLVRALRVAIGTPDGLLDDLPAGSGIEIRVVDIPNVGQALEVSLTNGVYGDLFDSFVADIAAAAAAATDANSVARIVAVRVRRWQAFLRAQLDGLTNERQRGLFGELHVLAAVLEVTGREAAVDGWVGPVGAPQDFAFGPTAIEVKTSAGKNPQRVRISSERQLDCAAVDHLYLWHLSVDERVGSGESLPFTVDRLRTRLKGSSAALAFEDALFAAGYHDAHANRYVIGYSLRSSDIFDVRDGFPRLTEADCPAGLGDVHYSLELGALSPFLTERAKLVIHLADPTDD